MSDHRPHIPWGGVVGLIRRHHDEDEAPTMVLAPVEDDTSIHDWLASADRRPAAAELPPAQVPALSPTDLPTMPMYLEAARVTVASVPSALQVTRTQIARVRERAHRDADALAAENDRRMEQLLAHSRAWGVAWSHGSSSLSVAWENTREVLARLLVTKRRRERVRPLVPELGHLVAAGDVDPKTAARIMKLRSDWMYALDSDSQRLPRMTPELLAEMDAERVAGSAGAR
jgi:hypothetical protein